MTERQIRLRRQSGLACPLGQPRQHPPHHGQLGLQFAHALEDLDGAALLAHLQRGGGQLPQAHGARVIVGGGGHQCLARRQHARPVPAAGRQTLIGRDRVADRIGLGGALVQAEAGGRLAALSRARTDRRAPGCHARHGVDVDVADAFAGGRHDCVAPQTMGQPHLRLQHEQVARRRGHDLPHQAQAFFLVSQPKRDVQVPPVRALGGFDQTPGRRAQPLQLQRRRVAVSPQPIEQPLLRQLDADHARIARRHQRLLDRGQRLARLAQVPLENLGLAPQQGGAHDRIAQPLGQRAQRGRGVLRASQAMQQAPAEIQRRQIAGLERQRAIQRLQRGLRLQ